MDKKGLSLMFHSRNPRYRNPVGAVEAGTSVHFRITVPRDQRCSAARLIVHRDAGGCDTPVSYTHLDHSSECLYVR